mgnify:CR=1 FL=1
MADALNWIEKKAHNGLKEKKILKGILDSILSPSPPVKIQIMGGKIFHETLTNQIL